MFSATSYLTAWGVCLLGCLGLMVIAWRLTTKAGLLRPVLLVSAAILMAMPYYADPGQDYLAPALIITLLEGIFDGREAMARAGAPLLAVWVGGVLLTVVVQIGWHRYYRQYRQKQQQQQALDNEREALIAQSEALAQNRDAR